MCSRARREEGAGVLSAEGPHSRGFLLQGSISLLALKVDFLGQAQSCFEVVLVASRCAREVPGLVVGELGLC